ncbi:hypothetical protein [Acinetobacter rathckeae]|uniref:hypothetical protein n=1 Tax=Acinetobacter rathckeae TaxID=2605272 RepID=UPI0018A2A86B|nr:hypothetical protein [Acinetobacter rathckeae]MBF7696713.1 hypothetical protein [Acinetobacter rathckeae]
MIDLEKDIEQQYEYYCNVAQDYGFIDNNAKKSGYRCATKKPEFQSGWIGFNAGVVFCRDDIFNLRAEITELKQQLSEAHASRASWVEYSQKVESGEFVLMPRELPGHIAESIINKGEFLESDPIWFGIMDTEYYKERLKDKIYELSLKHKSLIEAVEKDHE